MQFALYNNQRIEAEPGLKAICVHCSNDVIAKCGSKNIWHWAHVKTDNCDSWTEPETIWHRNWKNLFGKEFSEQRIEKDGVYHVADVINKNEIIFEFQNSSISSDLIRTREEFYGEKMIWIINGISFKDNFQIYDEEYLKNWKFTILNEFDSLNYTNVNNSLIIESWQVKIDIVRDYLQQNGFQFNAKQLFYYSDLGISKNREQLTIKFYSDLLELYNNTQKNAYGKVEFIWEHFRRSWQDSKRPVFIDFGEDFLLLVISGIGKKYGSGNKIRRSAFLQKYCIK
ncbi:MAG: hypothetical protein H0W73_12180 [Bacteroidetes bacterium]|nr:hypothetical protein [Bacteroidota bacterium]